MRRLVIAALLSGVAAPVAVAQGSDAFCTADYSIETERLAGEDRVGPEFAAMDTDGDGAVSKEEYVACRNAAAGTTSAEAERTSANMVVVDADSSGEISRDEFMATANIARIDAGNAEAPTDRPVQIFRRYIFIPANAAGAEVRSMSEYAAGQRARRMFTALDANGDDALNEAEWAAPSAELGDQADTIGAEFDKIDLNGDGALDVGEYGEAVAPAPAVEDDT